MTLSQEQISKTFKLMQERSEAPKLTPEQLNAIDLLILGKTDREVAEAVGVRRETVTKWHKNPFFSAELSIRREELWSDAKLRLKSLAHEAVNVLTRGLSSQDEKGSDNCGSPYTEDRGTVWGSEAGLRAGYS